MRKKNAVTLGLLINERRADGYYNLTASVITIGPNQWEIQQRENGGYGYPAITADTIRNAGDEEYAGLFLNNLTVYSQGNDETRDDKPRSLYAWEVRYQNVYAIDRWTAEKMAKTLKAIHTRMEKLTAKFGEPATIGAYLARVAEAIGAAEMVTLRDKTRRGGWNHSDQDYRRFTIGEGIYHVDYSLVHAWVHEREIAADKARQAARDQQARDAAEASGAA